MQYLSKYAARMLSLGYEVVPIPQGHKHPEGLPNWQTIEITESVVRRWATNGYAGAGVGVRTRHMPVLDVDILDPQLAEQAQKIVTEILGPNRFIRIGKAPKLAYTFRLADGEAPFGKIQTATREDFLGDRHKAEFLCDGQQLVTHAIHPETKEPYRWLDLDIKDHPLSELPPVTRKQAAAVIDELEAFLASQSDLSFVSRAKSSAAAGEVDYLSHYRTPLDLTEDEMRSAVFALDPDMEHDAWVDVGMAIWHQSAGSEEGFNLWREWSMAGAKFDAAAQKSLRKRWEGFEPDYNRPPITFASVLHMAAETLKEKQTEAKQEQLRRTTLLVPLEKMIAMRADKPWLVTGHLPTNSMGMVFGESGTMKSFYMIDVGLHIATGRDWHGHKTRVQGPVIYIAGEGTFGIPYRLKAWCQHHGVDPRGVPFYTSLGPVEFLDEDNAIVLSEQVAKIAGAYGKPALVIIDTLNRNFGAGNENSTEDMTRFYTAVNKYIRQPNECCVAIVHHQGHQEGSRARGSSVSKATLDWEYQVSKEGEARAVKNTKMKDHPQPEPLYFSPQIIDLGEWQDEEAQVRATSVVFEPTGRPEVAGGDGRPALSGQQLMVLDALRRACGALMVDDEAELKVKASVWKQFIHEIQEENGIEKDLGNSRFYGVRDALIKKGYVGGSDGYYWVI